MTVWIFLHYVCLCPYQPYSAFSWVPSSAEQPTLPENLDLERRGGDRGGRSKGKQRGVKPSPPCHTDGLLGDFLKCSMHALPRSATAKEKLSPLGQLRALLWSFPCCGVTGDPAWSPTPWVLPVILPRPGVLLPASPATWAPRLWPMRWTWEGE